MNDVKTTTKSPKLCKLRDKAILAIGTAAVTCSSLAVGAFASSGTASSTSVDYSSIGDSLKSGLVEMVNNVIGIAVSLVPIGLGIFGMGWVVKTVKNMFTKIAG